MRADLLAEKYPAVPDGKAEVPREQMSFDDVKFNRWRLTQQAIEAYGKADALDRWWRSKRKAVAKAG